MNFQQAYELILELGGIPCYPVLADGADPLCEYETPVEKLIETLKENKIYMAELIPVRNQPSILSHYVTAMRAAGIAVIAGTEHNTLELLPIEPSCAGKAAVPEEIEKIFVEGAYIVAAHQFLMAHGEQGYVDQRGNLNPQYKPSERRISAFAKLGAAVIQKYKSTKSGWRTAGLLKYGPYQLPCPQLQKDGKKTCGFQSRRYLSDYDGAIERNSRIDSKCN